MSKPRHRSGQQRAWVGDLLGLVIVGGLIAEVWLIGWLITPR